MAGPFDFLHIKRRTAGSSNELSFDVLDAASSGLANQKRHQSRTSVGPKPSQGTYHGVSGTSTLSAVPEVEKRKRARRTHALIVRVVTIALVLGLLGVAGYAGYRFYTEKVDFTSRFNAFITELTEIDQTLVTVDGLMSDPLNTVEQDKRAQALRMIPTLMERLDDIVKEAENMKAEATNEVDAGALDAILQAASSRKGMLSTASQAFTLSASINDLVVTANKSWDLVIDADMTAREATSAANTAATEQATQLAKEKSEAAMGEFSTAREGLVALEQEVGSQLFAAEEAYIDKRVESLSSAVETADALIAGEREAAARANDAYNSADREAVALAGNLPASPGEEVRAHYRSQMQTYLDAYKQARDNASAADAELRKS